jgi:hypothetical protein
MERLASTFIAAVFVAAQICCAPPLRAAATETAEPMHCPIQKQECPTAQPKECSGGPELVADFPAKKFTAPTPLKPLVPVISETFAPEETRIVSGWWSSPTRTIQLRI